MQHFGSPCSPRSAAAAPGLVPCCHLLPPRHNCRGAGMVKFGMSRASRMGTLWAQKHLCGPRSQQPWPRTAPCPQPSPGSANKPTTSPAHRARGRTPNISQPQGQHQGLFTLRQICAGIGCGTRGIPEQLGNGSTEHSEMVRVVNKN